MRQEMLANQAYEPFMWVPLDANASDDSLLQ